MEGHYYCILGGLMSNCWPDWSCICEKKKGIIRGEISKSNDEKCTLYIEAIDDFALVEMYISHRNTLIYSYSGEWQTHIKTISL